MNHISIRAFTSHLFCSVWATVIWNYCINRFGVSSSGSHASPTPFLTFLCHSQYPWELWSLKAWNLVINGLGNCEYLFLCWVVMAFLKMITYLCNAVSICTFGQVIGVTKCNLILKSLGIISALWLSWW